MCWELDDGRKTEASLAFGAASKTDSQLQQSHLPERRSRVTRARATPESNASLGLLGGGGSNPTAV